MPNVFLDHLSSTPLLPEAFEAMKPFFLQKFGSPSSLHQLGLQAREALTQARTKFCQLIGAGSPEEILFTSGGTEAANLAVKGVALANARRGKHIVLSAVEHPSVQNSVEFLQAQGFTATRVPVNAEGLIDPQAVRAALTDGTILICLQHANHDVGAIQPVRAVAALANERAVPLFVDASASGGWLPVNVQEWGIDLLSLAPHRFYGPKGVGVLYRRRGVRMHSLLHGGDQEQRLRAGTENVPAIVGAGVAASAAWNQLSARQAHTGKLQARLWEHLQAAVPKLALNGPPLGPKRMTTNLNVSAELTEGEGLLLALDLAGFAVAAGTACVSRAVKISPVLAAMGIAHAQALASVIFSLGKDNTEEEMDLASAGFAKAVARLRSMSPGWEEFQRDLNRAMAEPKTSNQPPSSSAVSATP